MKAPTNQDILNKLINWSRCYNCEYKFTEGDGRYYLAWAIFCSKDCMDKYLKNNGGILK